MDRDGGTTQRGLTSAEVSERVARGLVNRPPRSEFADYAAIAARNLLTVFNALVAPAGVVLFLLRDYRAAWAVSAMAITNSLIGLVQEVRAKHRLDKLAILTQTQARVRRDGVESTIPATDVVRDDVLVLAAGDAIVADGVVLEEGALEIDEALLTGESDPVPRRIGDRLMSGSFCVAGDGVFRADRVGGDAFALQISAEARRYRYKPSPMQQTLDVLIRILTAIAVALCGLYVALYFVRGFATDDLVRMIAATITAMVPQGLVLMTTLAFTLGAVRMSARGAIVQHLNAVESMASIDVLCMDKTGTLTTNRLTVDRVLPVLADLDEARAQLQRFAWVTPDERSKSIQALRTAFPRSTTIPALVEQIPFKSQNRFSAVRFELDGKGHALVVGAFEALKPFLDKGTIGRAESTWRDLLATGLRLLLLAQAKSDAQLNGSLNGIVLEPLAFVALSDELRPEAGPVLEALAAQGIRFKILSGDNAETVRATIAHLKLPLASEAVVSGERLESATDRPALIRDHSVFGRVAPRQKLDVVAELQAQGHLVGMIGDGVNDVLPIKRADLGIAMGEGSSAAKTVAGLLLENNNFGLLPETLDEGRTILSNLRRAAKLFLLKNVYLLLLILIGFGILGLGFPCEPQQVTLLNALTIGGPVLLIMIGRDPARSQTAKDSFLREVGWFALSTGLITAAAGLAVWSFATTVTDEPRQQTMLLSTLIVMGLGNVLRLGLSDRRLTVWVAFALAAYAVVMYAPAIGTYRNVPLSAAHFFEVVPLTLSDWALIGSVTLPGLVLCWSFDYGRPLPR